MIYHNHHNSSEGLVHPSTFSAQANDSNRQTLVSENKVNIGKPIDYDIRQIVTFS